MRKIQDVLNAKNRIQNNKTADTVSALPPAYMKGFILATNDEGQLVVGPGIGSIRGKRTVQREEQVVDSSSYAANRTMLRGSFYTIYVSSSLEYLIDLKNPVKDDDYYAYYHPTDYRFRYIGQFFLSEQGAYQKILSYDPLGFNSVSSYAIDSMLLSVQTFLQIGYNGNGTPDNPLEGDTFMYIDGDEISIVEYAGGAWRAKLKYGGSINNVFKPMLSGIGVDHVDDQISLSGENFPSSNFFVNTFNNVWLDQYGEDNWTHASHTFVTDWSKYSWTHSMTCTSGTWLFARQDTLGTVGDSFSVSTWVNLVLLPPSTPTVPYILSIQASTDFFLIHYDVGNEKFVASWDAGAGELGRIEIDAPLVGGLLGEHHIGVTFDSDTYTLHFFVDDQHGSIAVTPTFWTGSGTWRYFLFPSYNATLSSGNETKLFSETAYSYVDYIKPEIFIEHYNHNVAWTTERSRSDQTIRCAPGGKIRFEDHYGDMMQGLFHFLDEADRPSTSLYNGAPPGAWTVLDCSAYVPVGANGVRLGVYVEDTGTGTSSYIVSFRPNGSSWSHWLGPQGLTVSGAFITRPWRRTHIIDCPCDHLGRVEFYDQFFTFANISLTVLGYWT